MIVSPTEPARLRELGHVGMSPEDSGADFLIVPHVSWGGHLGVQRKEIKDLLASLGDGRLAEQLMKMRQLAQGLLLVEGKIRWTNDGEMMVQFGRGLNRASWRGLLWSARRLGIWVDYTDSIQDTADYLVALEKWSKKEHHTTFERTSAPVRANAWGRVENVDWQRHLLMALPGIGQVAANRILDKFGMPLRMAVSKSDLLTVEGLGPAKVDRLLAAVPQLENL